MLNDWLELMLVNVGSLQRFDNLSNLLILLTVDQLLVTQSKLTLQNVNHQI